MKISQSLTAVALLAGMSGCAMEKAMKEDSFRDYVAESSFMTVEEVHVKRPLALVKKDIRNKARECIHLHSVYASSGANTPKAVMYSSSEVFYTATVEDHPKQTSLYVKNHGGPRWGVYFVVADATAAGKNATKVVLYYPNYKAEMVVTGIKNWIEGKVDGCPALTH